MKNSFGHYISAIYRHLQIYVNHQFSAYGFGSGQHMFFTHIARHEGICQKELSRKMAIDKATTAKAVGKLIDLGYVTATRKESDKRSFGLYLTDQGKEILPAIQSRLRENTKIMQQGMNPEDIKVSKKVMNQMLVNITEKLDKIRSLDE